MPDIGLSLLSAMITPAVLISACGTLIFSTATRLARIVDGVRNLAFLLEQLFTGRVQDFVEERRREIDAQIAFYAQGSRLAQGALTSFYVALVLCNVDIGTMMWHHAACCPRIWFDSHPKTGRSSKAVCGGATDEPTRRVAREWS